MIITLLSLCSGRSLVWCRGKSDRNSSKSTRLIAGLIHTCHLLSLNKNAQRQQVHSKQFH